MRASVRLLTATCSLAVFATHARAQQDQIPRELALALIQFGASEGGEIIVGKLPPDLAASITLPPGGRVLGSFMSIGYGQAVLTLPFGGDSARSFVRQSLLDHGWSPRAPMGMASGGLQYAPRGSVPSMFCKPGIDGSVTLTTQFYGRETLVRLTRNSGISGCESPTQGVVVGQRVDFVQMSSRPGYSPFGALPPLWSPGDPMTSIRRCRPQSANGILPMRQQDQALHTELSAEQILAFYGKQLDSAGWKPLDTSHEVAKGSWSKTTAPDTTQDVTLTVTKADIPGCYEIELRTSTRGQKR